MMLENALQLIEVTAAYGALFLLAPYWLYGMRKRPEDFLTKLMLTLSLSTIQVVMSVYLLAFLHILSFFTLAALLLIETGLIYSRTRGITPWNRAQALYAFIMHVHDGHYKLRVFAREAFRRTLRAVLIWFKRLVLPQLLFVAAMAACLGFAFYIRAWPVITRMPYGVSDLYTYTSWVKALMNNQVFSSGVYFFGLHNVVASMAVLFRIDVVTLLRMFGVVFNMIGVLAVYWLARQILTSRWTAVLSMLIFSLIELYPPTSYFRQSYALSQEFSQLFWLIAGGFFIRFLRNPSRDGLWSFGAALCAIVLAHFYGIMVAGFFCAVYAVVYLPMLLRERALWLRRLAVVVAVAFAVGLLPMAVGLVTGIELEPSFLWGLSVVSETNPEAAAVVPAVQSSFAQRTLEATQLPLSFHIERLIPLLLSLCMAVYLIIRKPTRARGLPMLGLCGFQAVMYALHLAVPLGLPPLMDYLRAMMFFTMTFSMLYVIPLELMEFLPSDKARTAVTVAAFALVAPMALRYGVKTPFNSALIELDGSVSTYYDIKHEYPSHTWTIVSPVEETTLVQGTGHHYELYEFLQKMDPYSKTTNIEIPTAEVFFYVEKIPLNHELVDNADATKPYPMDPLEAKQPLPQISDLPVPIGNGPYVYYYSRRILMAKVDEWAQAFMQQFPDDMSVYYEDDELIVYHYRQNMYHLTNFAIDYGFNPYAE